MIDSKYINKLDAQDKRWYDSVLHNQFKDNESAALDYLLYWMDCSVIYPDNSRRCQTIDFKYRTDIGGYLYILDKITYNDDIRNAYYNKLIARHEENLSFEEHNPPTNYYRKKSRVSSRSNTRTATITDIFSGEKITVDAGSGKIIKSKENATTRKAKALKDKSISFAFNNFKIND